MKDIVWDVAVIGGGPSGMMAAGRAAELGAKVILIEKNDSLGKKLLITGGGRCNVTNAELDNRKLLEKFKDDGKFLFSAFSQYSVKETLDFFHKRNLETKIEAGQRVFPLSNKSQSVWNVMVEYIKKGNVTILSNSSVDGLLLEDKTHSAGSEQGNITGVKISGKTIYAHSVVVATGGKSHPETGSTGDAYKWLKNIGHTIIEPVPSLVPLATKDKWIKKLAGVSLDNIKLTVYLDGVKQFLKKRPLSKVGKILFTHVGVSGPTVLNMSKDIGELLGYGDVVVMLDLLPEIDQEKLNLKLLEIFKENDKKKFKNCLSDLILSSITPVVVELSDIDPEVQCNSVTREERIKLIGLLKSVPIHIDKLLGLDKAIVSSGGVSLNEIDFKTMRSRLHPNLYIIGDLLNIDRPSGGYSLQICWTTGFVAGTNIVGNK